MVPFDAELAAGLEANPGIVSPNGMTADMIPGIRLERMGTEPSDLELGREGRFLVSDLSVPGPAGQPDIALLICRPNIITPVPALYFVHGGGLVFNNRRTGGLSAALDWAEQTDSAVVSVEYRLPPEHPHPAPVEDCYAGLRWTYEHGGTVGLDAERMVLAGMSAGAGLAASMALLNRDLDQIPLIGQMLIAPMLDDRCDSHSMRQMAGPGVWDQITSRTGWGALLGDACGGREVSPFASPARADNLAGLPPTFIDVGSADAFRDEAVAYASGIWRDGGRAELHVWPGGFHGFDFFVPGAAISRAARRERIQWLQRILSIER